MSDRHQRTKVVTSAAFVLLVIVMGAVVIVSLGRS